MSWPGNRGSNRPLTLALGVVAAILILLEVIFRTPTAIAFNGIVYGGVDALTAVSLVLVYRSSRVINFAQTAFGALGAEMTFELVQLTKTPFLIALPLGILVGAGTAILFDIVLGRRLARA